MYRKRTLSEKFWKKVEKRGIDDCWLWIGAKKDRRYGHMLHNYQNIGSHRISWLIHHGNIPNNLWVLHKCDNPSCVNPNHLWLGTAKDNSQDRESKNRGNKLKGELSPVAKLTKKEVLYIRADYSPYKI